MQLIDLPAEILHMILSYLPKQKDISAFIRTTHILYRGFLSVLHATTQDKQDLLQWTCINGNPVLASRMLNLGAKLIVPASTNDIVDPKRAPPFIAALLNSQFEVANVIIDHDLGVLKYHHPETYETAFHIAIEQKRKDAVEALLSRPELDTNLVADYSESFLAFAVRWLSPHNEEDAHNEDILNLLLADPRFEVDGITLRNAASSQFSLDCIKHIIIQGKQYISEMGCEMLCKAVDNGREDIVDFLFTEIDQIDLALSEAAASKALLHAAARSDESLTAQIIARKNPSIEARDEEDSNTPLCIAAKLGHSRVVSFLLGKADVNAQNVMGQTALILASRGCFLQTVRLLLSDSNIEPDLRADFGRSALSYASEDGSDKIVLELLQTGRVDPNQVSGTTSAGTTPLIWATKGDMFATTKCEKYLPGEFVAEISEQVLRNEITKALEGLEHISVEALMKSPCLEIEVPQDDHNDYYIYEFGKRRTRNALEVMKHLLAFGADPDYPDSQGGTPLLWAVSHNQLDAILLLLSTNRVDPHFEANYGVSPVILARENCLFVIQGTLSSDESDIDEL